MVVLDRRLYEGFGPGGLLADIKQGVSNIRHLRSLTRTAVVTDKAWIVHTIHALAWLIPGEIALFGLDDLEAAKTWAAGETTAEGAVPSQ